MVEDSAATGREKEREASASSSDAPAAPREPAVKPPAAVTRPVKIAPGQPTPPLTKPPARPLRDADPVAPRVEVVSAGSQGPPSPPSMPEASRDRYMRLPTGPTAIAAQQERSARNSVGAWSPVDEPPVEWEPAEWQPAQTRDADVAPLAPWALTAAIIALTASFFVGWGLPLAVLALIAGIMCVRRPNESRIMSVWAVWLSAVATVFSAGWLVWAAWVMGWIG